jgi:hypothetical protein
VRAEIQEHALTFEAPCPTVRKTHLDRPGRDEAALAQDELEPIGCEPRPVERDRVLDHCPLAPAHAGHVRGRGPGPQAELHGVTEELRDLGAVDDVLAGHAGDVRA